MAIFCTIVNQPAFRRI